MTVWRYFAVYWSIYSSKEGIQGEREKNALSIIKWLTTDQRCKNNTIHMDEWNKGTKRKRETKKKIYRHMTVIFRHTIISSLALRKVTHDSSKMVNIFHWCRYVHRNLLYSSATRNNILLYFLMPSMIYTNPSLFGIVKENFLTAD